MLAAVTLTAALVPLSPFGTSKNSSIVWAETMEKVHEMRTFVHKERRIGWEIGKEENLLTGEVIRYVSEEHGLAEHQFDDKGTLMYRAYFLNETRQFIIVIPAEKKYLKLSLPGDIFDRITGMLTPLGVIEYYTSGHYTELGHVKFGDIDVKGVETTDPNVLFPIPEPLRSMCPARDFVGRLWIDSETSLPIRTELEFNMDRGLLTGFKKLHGEWSAYDFQWNVDIPEGTFDPNIPDDYTEIKITDFIPAEAKAGIVGLGMVPVGLIYWRQLRKKRTLILRN